MRRVGSDDIDDDTESSVIAELSVWREPDAVGCVVNLSAPTQVIQEPVQVHAIGRAGVEHGLFTESAVHKVLQLAQGHRPLRANEVQHFMAMNRFSLLTHH